MRRGRMYFDGGGHLASGVSIPPDRLAGAGSCAPSRSRHPFSSRTTRDPQLRLLDRARRPLGGDPIAECGALLRAGRIVAIEGIGGLHLACRADSQEAVLRLRARKRRETEPFAVMVADLEAARRCGQVDAFNEGLLISPARPIVLLPKRPESSIAPAVSPGLRWIGIMLPYAALHHALFAQGLPPLVMTSGRRNDRPEAASKREAIERARKLADASLTHARDIGRLIDGSLP